MGTMGIRYSIHADLGRFFLIVYPHLSLTMNFFDYNHCK